MESILIFFLLNMPWKLPPIEKLLSLRMMLIHPFFFFYCFWVNGLSNKVWGWGCCKNFWSNCRETCSPWTASDFSLQSRPLIKYECHENKGNDRQLWKLFIVRQISLVITQQQPTITTSLANSVMCFPN